MSEARHRAAERFLGFRREGVPVIFATDVPAVPVAAGARPAWHFDFQDRFMPSEPLSTVRIAYWGARAREDGARRAEPTP